MLVQFVALNLSNKIYKKKMIDTNELPKTSEDIDLYKEKCKI